MTPNIVSAFSLDNLKLAWRRMLTSRDHPSFKAYFRRIYRAYSLSSHANLADLHERLLLGHFNPTHAIKTYVPKSSGTLRPITLLSVEDQIVYQALVNIVADKLLPRVRRRYYRTVFGNLYSGPSRIHFYKDYRVSYARFSRSIQNAFADGNDFTATFDLTACFDSIDHAVLKYFLQDLGLEPEFGDYLCELLSHWSATSSTNPIFHGHGIPQGPQPSGLLAECVLRHFDDSVRNSRTMRYFRYVDDIRLFAGSEKQLRKQLVHLEFKSKEIGLFPQSHKINIHQVKNIDDEIKTISRPPDPIFQKLDPDQVQLRRRTMQLTPRFTLTDETKFKYLVTRAAPNAHLAGRLLTIVQRNPHLFDAVFTFLSRAQALPKSVSSRSLAILYDIDLYPTYSASLIRALTGRIHPAYQKEFLDYCHARLLGQTPATDCEMVAALASALLLSAPITWSQLSSLISTVEWWGASEVVTCVRSDSYGKPSYEALLNDALRHAVPDVAIVAAELIIVEGLSVRRPIRDIQKIAQLALRASGLIGRVRSGRCLFNEAVNEVLVPPPGNIDWKKLFGRHYTAALKKVAPWRGYSDSDPSAWVNLTDTINDSLLDSLFGHDATIGGYALGRIGAVLTPGNRFASKYPKLFRAVTDVHNMRLESDLSHAITQRTKRPTRRLTHKEMANLKRRLREGYIELSKKW